MSERPGIYADVLARIPAAVREAVDLLSYVEVTSPVEVADAAADQLCEWTVYLDEKTNADVYARVTRYVFAVAEDRQRRERLDEPRPGGARASSRSRHGRSDEVNPNSEHARKVVEAAELYRYRNGAARLAELEPELRMSGEPEAVEAAEFIRHILDANRELRLAEHEGERAEADRLEATLAALFEGLREVANAYRCEGCGEPSEPGRDLTETITSPPVSGYAFESGLFHEDCGYERSRELVR